MSCGSEAFKLWLGLYTSQNAKRSVPGLWPGSLYGMSEDTRLPLNNTFNALGELVEKKLVEFDEAHRLARLTQLPDALERAHTQFAIKGWWTRFTSLPACPLRDAHVPLLWWMIQQGKVGQSMVDMWRMTFGTVAVPVHVPPFQPPGSADTGTEVQPSLFGVRNLSPKKNNNSDDPPSMGLSMPHGWPHGLDQDQDLDQVSEKGDPEGGGAIARPHLQLVPNLADPAPDNGLVQSAQDEATRARNERAADMKEAFREAAEAAGVTHLL